MSHIYQYLWIKQDCTVTGNIHIDTICLMYTIEHFLTTSIKYTLPVKINKKIMQLHVCYSQTVLVMMLQYIPVTIDH